MPASTISLASAFQNSDGTVSIGFQIVLPTQSYPQSAVSSITTTLGSSNTTTAIVSSIAQFNFTGAVTLVSSVTALVFNSPPPPALVPPPTDSSKLSGGAIAGIVIGCFVFAVLAVLFLLFFIRRKQGDKREGKAVAEDPHESRLDTHSPDTPPSGSVAIPIASGGGVGSGHVRTSNNKIARSASDAVPDSTVVDLLNSGIDPEGAPPPLGVGDSQRATVSGVSLKPPSSRGSRRGVDSPTVEAERSSPIRPVPALEAVTEVEHL